MTFLELKIPPALVFLAFGASLWGAATFFPSLNISFDRSDWFSGCFTIAGGLSVFAGLVEFHRGKTTVDPMKPGSASSIVTSGVYRLTRNPMYLGLLFLLIAFTIGRLNVLSPFLLIGFVVYMNRFQIIPEEEALTQKFGDVYLAYKQSVRRWI